MKTITLSIALLLMFSPVFSQNARQERRAERKAQEAARQIEIKTAVENKDFKIAVNRASPLRGRSISLTSSYDLAVQNDSATAYLPYFGVTFRADYGSTEGGIKFTEPMFNYTTKFNKRKGYVISFEIKSQKDFYRININIGISGHASINISPTNSDSIIYNGELILTEPKFVK